MIRTIQSLHRYLLLAAALLPLISLPSRQRKALVEDVQVESVLIPELKLNDKSVPELERTIFSIDHRRGLMYNARPLPKGTEIGRVRLRITTSPDALPKIYIGGVEQPSTSGLDTINMSKYAEGVRIVMRHRKNVSLTRKYKLMINIYDCSPYTHTWAKSARAASAVAMNESIVLSRLVNNDEAYYYFARATIKGHLWRASHKEPELWREVTISTLDSPIMDIAELGGSDAILCLQGNGQTVIYEHQGGRWDQGSASPDRASYLLDNLYYRGANTPLMAVKSTDGVHSGSGRGMRVPKAFPLENNACLSLTIEHHPVSFLIRGPVTDITTLVHATSDGLDWLTPHDAKVVSKIWPNNLPGAMIYEPRDQTILLIKPAARPKYAEQPAMRVYVSLDHDTVWQPLIEESILPPLYYDKEQKHQYGLALYHDDDGRIYLFDGLKGGAPTPWIG